MDVPSLLLSLMLASGGDVAGDVVSVDFPHGHCRVNVRESGGGTIAFAALPHMIDIEPGTFDFAEVADLLQRNSSPQSEVPMTPETGSVSLFGDSLVRSLTDEALFRRLLERAWQARIPPDNEFVPDLEATLAATCGLDQDG
ncbi:hypothetical protein [Marilutibacter maris]|uniref:hypothetical protein n=1 Tax=Marilutibacter maris TaxID=1605891 RepID=UPI0011AE73BF|nr:hypothetical protein [Lysobacter maris]